MLGCASPKRSNNIFYIYELNMSDLCEIVSYEIVSLATNNITLCGQTIKLNYASAYTPKRKLSHRFCIKEAYFEKIRLMA